MLNWKAVQTTSLEIENFFKTKIFKVKFYKNLLKTWIYLMVFWKIEKIKKYNQRARYARTLISNIYIMQLNIICNKPLYIYICSSKTDLLSVELYKHLRDKAHKKKACVRIVWHIKWNFVLKMKNKNYNLNIFFLNKNFSQVSCLNIKLLVLLI